MKSIVTPRNLNIYPAFSILFSSLRAGIKGIMAGLSAIRLQFFRAVTIPTKSKNLLSIMKLANEKRLQTANGKFNAVKSHYFKGILFASFSLVGLLTFNNDAKAQTTTYNFLTSSTTYQTHANPAGVSIVTIETLGAGGGGGGRSQPTTAEPPRPQVRRRWSGLERCGTWVTFRVKWMSCFARGISGLTR